VPSGDGIRHLAAVLVVEKLETKLVLSCRAIRYRSAASIGGRAESIRLGGFPAVVVETRRNQRAYRAAPWCFDRQYELPKRRST
jgi:hypothetical protein